MTGRHHEYSSAQIADPGTMARAGVRPPSPMPTPMRTQRQLLEQPVDIRSHPSLAPLLPHAAGNAAIGRALHRLATTESKPSVSPQFTDHVQSQQGGGQQIPGEVRQSLESGTGASLTRVRLHVDDKAAELVAQVRARAFAIGQDIYFGQNEYAPGSTAGYHLLAHEVAHTLQPNVDTTPATSSLTVGAADSLAEHQADKWADRLTEQRLATAADGTRPDDSSAIKRSSGNSHGDGTARVLRRQPSDIATATGRDQIEQALRSRDPGDAKATDINQATESEKLTLIQTLAYQAWVGPFDEYKIEDIWRSFGDKLAQIGSANMPLWSHCIAVGAELDNLPQVTALQERFVQDVKNVVAGYLFHNRQVVMEEMQRLGLPAEENAPALNPTGDQIEQTRQLQVAATAVAKLQKAQEEARTIYVGYQMQAAATAEDAIPAWIPVTFDPYSPPQFDSAPDSIFAPTVRVTTVPYQQVKEKYDQASNVISAFLISYPALFALTRQGSSEATASFAGQTNANQARQQLAVAMRHVIRDIEETQRKLDGGGLEPLDLRPIHEQLFAGTPGGSPVRWADDLPHWAASQLVGDHEFNQALVSLGLQTAAAALFMLAPFTGGASLYVMLAGLAVTGTKFYLSQQQYETLAQAAGTSVTPGTELVRQHEVDTAELVRNADLIALALASLAVAGEAAVQTIGANRSPAAPGNAAQGTPVQEGAASAGTASGPSRDGPTGLPPDFEVPEDFPTTVRPEGPVVRIPADTAGTPARVLEIGAGPADTYLGLPTEPGQGDLAVHDQSLVAVTRSGVQARGGIVELDATQAVPPGLRNQSAVIINNPHGYDVEIANIGEAVRPGGRIIVQGRAEVVPGMRGTNPYMNRLLRKVTQGQIPPGYRVVDVVTLSEVPSGNPAAELRPPQIMGGPFNRTTGGPVSWPNTRIVIERLPTTQIGSSDGG